MDKLIKIMNEVGIPFAYDHFAEGESPDPPFICYLPSAVIISLPMAECITR